jgi:hypothetical protein
MKLKKSTVFLTAVALTLTGFVYFYEMQKHPEDLSYNNRQKSQPVFDFSPEQVQSITIITSQETIALERVKSEATGKNQWQITAPIQKPADTATVDFLVDQLANLKSDRTIATSALKLPDYGLDKPVITTEIKLNNQKTYRLLLGNADFSNTLIYGQRISPEDQELSVVLLPINLKNVIGKPVSDWQATKSP